MQTEIILPLLLLNVVLMLFVFITFLRANLKFVSQPLFFRRVSELVISKHLKFSVSNLLFEIISLNLKDTVLFCWQIF